MPNVQTIVKHCEQDVNENMEWAEARQFVYYTLEMLNHFASFTINQKVLSELKAGEIVKKIISSNSSSVDMRSSAFKFFYKYISIEDEFLPYVVPHSQFDSVIFQETIKVMKYHGKDSIEASRFMKRLIEEI